MKSHNTKCELLLADAQAGVWQQCQTNDLFRAMRGILSAANNYYTCPELPVVLPPSAVPSRLPERLYGDSAASRGKLKGPKSGGACARTTADVRISYSLSMLMCIHACDNVSNHCPWVIALVDRTCGSRGLTTDFGPGSTRELRLSRLQLNDSV